MAELAGMASIAGLVSLAFQLGDVALRLRQLCKKFSNVPSTLERIVLEVTVLELHIQQLQRCSATTAASGMVAFQHDSAIQLCQRSVDSISRLLEKFERKSKRSETLGRLAFLIKETEVRELLQELEQEKSSLILATQILTESGVRPRLDLIQADSTTQDKEASRS
jgi:hypothetical protein